MSDQHPFDQAVSIANRLAKVAPRITYVILCWEEPWPDDLHNRYYPDAILGPFTEREAMSVAATLTCECEVTNVTTEPPAWATKGPGAVAPSA